MSESGESQDVTPTDGGAANTPLPATPPAVTVNVSHSPSPTSSAFVRRGGKTRNPWGVWLLSLMTLGIYGYYWYFKVNEETRDYESSVHVDPIMALLALMFGWVLCFIPPIVSIFNTGGRIQQAQKAAGSHDRCSGALGLLLAFLGGFHTVYYQSQINKVWDQYHNPDPGTIL